MDWEPRTGDSRDESLSRASSFSGRRVTRELFLCSTATVRRRNESDDDFLARVTHLRLQNKGISSLDSDNVFDACPSLKVLYLYDNCVESLKGVERLNQLEQMFAENNRLVDVGANLPCRRLTKLNLSGNCISVVRGLEDARCLEELHVARQRLPPGELFSIDQASKDGIKDSLVVLDVSGNGMGGEEIETVLDLYRLEKLNFADNDIQEMAQVVDIVTSLEDLKDCDLRGNAVCRSPKYFERAVTRCGDSLATLDGKPVHAQHRSMLQRLDRHKRAEAINRKNSARSNASAARAAPMAEIGIPSEDWGGPDDGSVLSNHGKQAPRNAWMKGSQSMQADAHTTPRGSSPPLITWPDSR